MSFENTKISHFWPYSPYFEIRFCLNQLFVTSLQVTITVKEKDLPSAATGDAANDEEYKREKMMAETSADPAHPVTPQQTRSMHLLDAHIIFEPLLSSLGLMPQQIQNLSLKNLGSNISVLGSINEFRVDIIESEFGGHSSSRKAKPKSGATSSSSSSDQGPIV